MTQELIERLRKSDPFVNDPVSLKPRLRNPDGPEAADTIASLQASVAGPVNYEELSIQHGQQVTITFKDTADAFALFNELKARATLGQPNGQG